MSSSMASAVTRAPISPATAMHLSIAAIAAALGSPTSGNRISLIAMVCSPFPASLAAIGNYSVLPPPTDQIRRRFNHPFAVLEKPLIFTTDKVDLVPTTFLAQRLDVPDRVRCSHFRGELGKQLHLGSRTVEHLIVGIHH